MFMKESKFKETGVLTPEEFVAAGEHLVHHCPTWQWAVGDVDRTKPYLPKDKQFLLTRNVPCSRRCKQVRYYIFFLLTYHCFCGCIAGNVIINLVNTDRIQ